MLRRSFVALALVGLIGCGGDNSPPPKPWYQGTWSGVTGTQTLTLNMTEGSGGAVTGSGTLSFSGGPRALTVVGSYAAPNLNITVSSGTLQPFNLKGVVNGSTMTATLTGSGFTGDALTMTRTDN